MLDVRDWEWSAASTIGAMIEAAWIAVGGVTLVLAVLGLVAPFRKRWRQRAAEPGSTAMLEARRAIRQSACERRRRGRGTIRGQGSGGADRRASDAGFSSDTGGMP
ncbi:hypothetical protein GCM10010172_73470 [Paractinoplanes ferrugineus]|uniref:Uncharacterized protein n=1 Tax=Paractinoplanes ferrugineus TaxID=113564 RepID=A0A919J088_9ACTN|nr:hypothetical protein Afe05nite_33380 [Actinoplanes ferrugineus]